MSLLLPSRFSRQPQVATAIDWGNSLTRGLVLDWSAVNPLVNQVDGQRVVAASPSPINALQIGRARDFTNAVDGDTSWGGDYWPLSGATQFTVEAYFRQTASSSYANLVSKFDSGGPLFLRIEASGQIGIGSNQIGFFAGTSNSYPLNAWTYVCATYFNGFFTIYINGRLDATSSQLIVAGLASTSQNLQIGQGTGGGAGGAPKADIAFARLRKVALSPAEVWALAQNPWQVYKPNQKSRLSRFISLGQSFQFSRPTTDVLTGWTRVPASGTHVSAINETTSNQSDYLSAASTGLVDSFTMGQLQQPSDGALQINYDIDASVRGTKIELLNGGSVVKTATISVASAGRFLPQRWRKQPQRPVEMDWSNPITRGLRMCISPSTNPRREIAIGHDYTWNGLNLGFTATPNGRAFAKYLNGASYQSVSVDDPLNANSFVMAGSGGEFTCAIVIGFIPSEINRPNLNSNQIVSVDLASQAGDSYSFNLNTYSLDSANTFRIETRSFDIVGEAEAYAISNQIAIAPRRGQNVFFSSIDTSSGFYVNSIGSAVQANSNVNGQLGLPVSNWSGISVLSNNNMNVAVATMVLWWTRYLSSAEKSSMQDNPWQIFRPAIPRFFSLPAPTGTIEVSSAELSSVSWPWTPTVRITSQ